jgi:hypothetical protein
LFSPAPGWLGYTRLARLNAADWLVLKDTHFKQQQVYSFTPFFALFRSSAAGRLASSCFLVCCSRAIGHWQRLPAAQ